MTPRAWGLPGAPRYRPLTLHALALGLLGKVRVVVTHPRRHRLVGTISETNRLASSGRAPLRSPALNLAGACTHFETPMLSLVGARMDFEAECLAFPMLVLVGPPGIRTRTRLFKHPSPVTRAGTRIFKHAPSATSARTRFSKRTSPTTRTGTRFSKLHGNPRNGLLRKLELWQSRVTPSLENPATARDNSAETTFALSQVRIPPPPSSLRRRLDCHSSHFLSTPLYGRATIPMIRRPFGLPGWRRPHLRRRWWRRRPMTSS